MQSLKVAAITSVFTSQQETANISMECQTINSFLFCLRYSRSIHCGYAIEWKVKFSSSI